MIRVASIPAFVKVLTALALAATTAGCAYKPMKAPCAREDADVAPLAYAPEPGLAAGPFSARVGAHDCGPLRPINE